MIDLTNKKFGRLLAIKIDHKTKKRIMWLCRCDCGTEKIVSGEKLRSGNTKSCNCLRNTLLANEIRLGNGYANLKELYRSYKKSAKKRNYIFDLNLETFKKITSSNCYYCGIEPKQVKNHKECFGKYIYNGIDRIDNKKGYILGNVVPCCKICNSAKNTQTIEEFKEWHNRLEARIKHWTEQEEQMSLFKEDL
jgi:hypothetical protein